MAVEINQAVPLPDAADQASRSGRRRCAGPGRPAGTPGTSYALAARPGGTADQAPEAAAAEQAMPAYHGITSGLSADW